MWHWLRRIFRPTPTPTTPKLVRRPNYDITVVQPPMRHHTSAAVRPATELEWSPRSEAPLTDLDRYK